MDFGIAKATADRKLTMTGTTMGSLYYMSPEQIQGVATLGYPRRPLLGGCIALRARHRQAALRWRQPVRHYVGASRKDAGAANHHRSHTARRAQRSDPAFRYPRARGALPESRGLPEGAGQRARRPRANPTHRTATDPANGSGGPPATARVRCAASRIRDAPSSVCRAAPQPPRTLGRRRSALLRGYSGSRHPVRSLEESRRG